MVTPPIRSSPTDGKTDSFSPSILPSSRNQFILGTSTAITPSETQEVLPTPVGRKYSIGSSFSTSSLFNDPVTPILLPCSSGSRSSPDISFAPSSLAFFASGRCFRTWVLITYQFFYKSLSRQSIAPTSVPLPSIFRKLAGMTLPFTLTLTVLLQQNVFFCFFCFICHFYPPFTRKRIVSLYFGREVRTRLGVAFMGHLSST